MRNMSFPITTRQVMARTKTVTRRLGWINAEPGQQVLPVEKLRGLRKGEKIRPIGEPITFTSIRREPLSTMLDHPVYGANECAMEGFGDDAILSDPREFVAMFCRANKCSPDTIVTRIEFEYEEP